MTFASDTLNNEFFTIQQKIPQILYLINDYARDAHFQDQLYQEIVAFLQASFGCLSRLLSQLNQQLDLGLQNPDWKLIFAPYLTTWLAGYEGKESDFSKDSLRDLSDYQHLQKKITTLAGLDGQLIQKIQTFFETVLVDEQWSFLSRAAKIYYYQEQLGAFEMRVDRSVLSCSISGAIEIDAIWIQDPQRSFRYLWDEKMMLGILNYLKEGMDLSILL